MELRTWLLAFSLQYMILSVQCGNNDVGKSETAMDFDIQDFLKDLLPDTLFKNAEGPSLRIIGGIDADVDDYPWAARIFEVGNPDNHRHWCGGALIAQHFVLTAAHCVRTYKPACNGTARNYVIEVVVDRVHYRDPEVFTSEYNDCDQIRPIYADIALLKLTRVNRKMTEIDLPYAKEKDFAYFGGPGMVIGWGRTLVNTKGSASVILQKLGVEIFHGSHEPCKYYRNDIDTTICVISSDISGACKGDSGGPLFAIQPNGRPILLGLTSFGDNPCNPLNPVMYTRVYAFMLWITNIVNANPVGTHHSEL